MSAEDGMYISKGACVLMLRRELRRFEGVFQMEVDPGRVKADGIMVITINGVPKE